MESPADRLKKARKDAGYATATDAARAMGVKPPTYLGHENGTTGLRRTAAIRYAKFYGMSLDWLLTGVGEGRRERLVPVVGYVGAGAEMHPFDDFPMGQGLEHVEPPPGEGDCLALRIRGDSMHPFQEGWLVFYRRDFEGVPENCVGQLCVVQVKDGPILVKILRKGTRKKAWRLESWNAATRDDVKLDWASKVIDIRPSDLPVGPTRLPKRG
jgi:phage repressor protein C with HTH and peptisase S24 domain